MENEPHNLPEPTRKDSKKPHQKKRHSVIGARDILKSSYSDLIRTSEEFEDSELKENMKTIDIGLKSEDFDWESSMRLIRQWEKEFPLEKPSLGTYEISYFTFISEIKA